MPDTALLIDDLGDGMNTIDPMVSPKFPMTQAVSLTNMVHLEGGLGRRRNGCTSLLPGDTGTVPFNAITAIVRDNQNEQAPIMWTADFAQTVRYVDPATRVWTTPAIPAAPTVASLPEFNGVSFNGKVFFGYRHTGAVDRLACYDPLLAKIRYVGISAPAAAPTVANTGIGAYAATIRYYRQRYLQKNGSTVVRMGEPSASVSFTPSGAGTAARITKAATINEDETHWMIEASPDNQSFYELVTVAVATTTYDDSAAVSTYANGTLAKIAGTCTVPPNAKYVITDGSRILFANWAEQGLGSRVGWTSAYASQNIGDDERMFVTNTLRPYQDLNPKNGGDITGFEQIDGVVYVFKAKQIWRGTPTEDLSKPYIWRRITNKIGCVFSKSLTQGEDAAGNPALYFLSHRGPYRLSANGLEYLGRDLEGRLLRADGSPNFNTGATVISHSTYYDDTAQWWLWVCSGSAGHSPATFPDTLFVLQVKRATRKDTYGVRGGWVEFTGDIALTLCSALGPRSGYNGRPWLSIGSSYAGLAALYYADAEGVSTDGGTVFSAGAVTRSLIPLGRRVHLGTPLVQGRVVSGSAITLTLSTVRDRDLISGIQTGQFSLSVLTGLTPCQGVTLRDAGVVQLILSDGGGTVDLTTIQPWVMESVYVPLYYDQELP